MQIHDAFHEEMPHEDAYMTATVVPIGTQIAHELRISSGSVTARGCVPNTLRELFDIFNQNPPKSLSMLYTTWSVLAGYLQTPADQITIDSVFENKEGFPRFLESVRYARNSVRSYANYERILLAKAEELGWDPNEAFPEAWRGVLALAPDRKCADITKSLARIKKSPANITIEDVDSWVQMSTVQGRSLKYMQSKKTWFCRLLRDCVGLELTPITHQREKSYGIPLEQLPPELKKELIELLRWKQSVYSHGRPKDARHRKTTALNLQQVTCSVVGYAINIRGEVGLTSLSQVITESIIGAFAEWSINERGVKLGSLQQNLRLLSAAVRQHPAYKPLEWGWFQLLLDGLPAEPESELKDRKAAKYVEYLLVETIPEKIRADKLIAKKKRPDQVHPLAMKELMMRWLVTLPWRQRNLRECRIGGASPNLFKARIPPLSDIDKPQWVKDEELRNPTAEFWQFKFSSEETKMGNGVRALLPSQLINTLEEFLQIHRSHLLVNGDPGTLFVNSVGRAMSKNQLTGVVSEITMRYCGKRITPHPFRDIVAFTWLKAHPKDYLTLSKMLWHRSIRTTISVYGGRFNESSGVCAMEAWLNERAAKST